MEELRRGSGRGTLAAHPTQSTLAHRSELRSQVVFVALWLSSIELVSGGDRANQCKTIKSSRNKQLVFLHNLGLISEVEAIDPMIDVLV